VDTSGGTVRNTDSHAILPRESHSAFQHFDENEPIHAKYAKLSRKIKTNPRLLGYHVPAVRRRDLFYAKLEDQRAEALGQV
jgi:hypothetical protein